MIGRWLSWAVVAAAVNGKTAGWCVAQPMKTVIPSLAITAKGEKVLLRCWAGCDTAAIVDAIGLCMSDLFEHDDDDRRPLLKAIPFPRRGAPEGIADPFALEWAVDLVIDDVAMLTVEGLVMVLRQAASDPLQWLWLERAFAQAGMSASVVWQVLYPHKACPYVPDPVPQRQPSPPVHLQGRPLTVVRLQEKQP